MGDTRFGNSLDKLARFFRNSPDMKTRIRPVLITFALVCFGFFPRAHAVVPPPDGGYPNFTTAEGTNSLKNLTTGAANTAVGWYSLFGDTAASFNTAVGAGTLLFNNGDQNTAVGVAALLSNTTGSFNTASGVSALSSNTTGLSNNAFGWGALLSNTTGANNTAIGVRALQSNTEGNTNVAVGEIALSANTTGGSNIAIGHGALSANTTGIGNTALGSGAGFGLTTGDGNVCIGQGVTGPAGESFTTRISNIWGQPGGTQAVYVDFDGRLGVNVSSRRFKEEIRPMDKASEVIYSLKPVSFRYKREIERTRPLSFGLIAEDVEQINADLVLRGKDGKVSTVRYEAVNAMLLNEFLKEHRKAEKQEATIRQLESTVAQQQKDFQATAAHQQKQIEALSAGLQKVSAQIEASKPAPHVVNNP